MTKLQWFGYAALIAFACVIGSLFQAAENARWARPCEAFSGDTIEHIPSRCINYFEHRT